MAQAMASMAGLRGSSQAVLEGSLQISGSGRLTTTTACTTHRVSFLPKSGFTVRAQQGSAGDAESSRRAVLGLVAAGLASGSFVQAVLAEAKPIKIGGPPPFSGGLRKHPRPFSTLFFRVFFYHIIGQVSAVDPSTRMLTIG